MPFFKSPKDTYAASDDVFANVALEDGWSSPATRNEKSRDKSVAASPAKPDTPAPDDDGSKHGSTKQGSKHKFTLSEDAQLWECDGKQFVVDPLLHVSSRIVRSFLADGRLHCETRGSVYAFTVLMPMRRMVSSYDEVERAKQKVITTEERSRSVREPQPDGGF